MAKILLLVRTGWSFPISFLWDWVKLISF